MNVMGCTAGQVPQHTSPLIIVAANPLRIFVNSDSSQCNTFGNFDGTHTLVCGKADRWCIPRRSLLEATATGAAPHVVFGYPGRAQRSIHTVITLGRTGNGHVQMGRDTIPIFRYSFPKIEVPENLEVWITTTLE